MRIEPIGHIESPFPVKFGVPRQPGLVRGLVSWLVLDGASRPRAAGQLRPGGRVWVLWGFSENAGRAPTPTIRPPRLGGNARVGVFASRSSFRPNALAISAVRVSRAAAEGRLALVGADMVDGTPVYGLRPYDPAADSFPGARAGWLAGNEWPALDGVEVPPELEARIPPELREGVREVLAQDPRPAYTRGTQPGRVFWVPIGHVVVRFTVDDVARTARVVDVDVLDARRYEILRETGRYE